MNSFGIAFTVALAVSLLTLPRHFAAIPLLLSVTYMTPGQVIEIGPANFTSLRILVFIGAVRVLLRGEWIAGGFSGLDRLLILWALWLLFTSVFHKSGAFVFRAGIIWTDLGAYFLFRAFVQESEDVERVFKAICVMLVPIAAFMLLEKYSGTNLLALLSGAELSPAVRHGHVRAQGPFAHAILAGTVGAACLGMAVGLWVRDRKYAVVGLFASLGMVFAATSSGPVIMAGSILMALYLWRVRSLIPGLRWLLVLIVCALDMYMKDPFYYIVARIDITGGSTGWYRAKLIQSTIEYLDEWWLIGTDFTRHWMPTGIYIDPNTADITNYFVMMGVWGGLPLFFLFILTLVTAFRYVGKTLSGDDRESNSNRFLVWTTGSILFGYVVNFFGISLFDETSVYFFFILSAIGAFVAKLVSNRLAGETHRA